MRLAQGVASANRRVTSFGDLASIRRRQGQGARADMIIFHRVKEAWLALAGQREGESDVLVFFLCMLLGAGISLAAFYFGFEALMR